MQEQDLPELPISSFRGPEIIKKTEIKKPFLGMEPSGALHLGHYLLLKALKTLSKEHNCIPLVYLADYHAKLNEKKNVEHYCEKTKTFLNLFFEDVNIKTSTDVFKDTLYMQLFNEFIEKTNLNEASRSLPEDLKLKVSQVTTNNSIKLKYLIYSIYQAVDVRYFSCDTVLCGIDQRKVYAYGYDIYAKLNWPKYNLIMYPLISKTFKIDKYDAKMSSSYKKSIFLDKTLYEALNKYLHGQKDLLSDNEKTLINTLLSNEDPSVLELYGCKTNNEFLNTLYKDLEPLKSFTW